MHPKGNNSRDHAENESAGLGRMVVSLPAGLGDERRLRYVLEAMLKPLGLNPEFEVRDDSERSVQLSWPGRQAGHVDVGLSRLRDAFEVISGRRETNVPRDHFGRVSAAALGGDYSRPVLSEWACELADSLAAMNPEWCRPHRQLTVYLTHDVDIVHPLSPVSLAGPIVRALRGAFRLNLLPAKELASWMARPKRFWQTYEYFMQMEQQAGVRATYFFMAGPYNLRRFGAHGGRPIRRLRSMTHMASQCGHRIGLHGCTYSLARDNYASQRQELSLVADRETTWHRNHYLVWDAMRSPAVLTKAGIDVDSTCGFHDANGFRAGIAWPYELWDLQADRPSGVIEIPLIFMDAAGDLSSERTWAELYERLESAAAVGGRMAVLFHVDLFVGHPERVKCYRDLLTWLGKRRAVLAAEDALPKFSR